VDIEINSPLAEPGKEELQAALTAVFQVLDRVCADPRSIVIITEEQLDTLNMARALCSGLKASNSVQTRAS